MEPVETVNIRKVYTYVNSKGKEVKIRRNYVRRTNSLVKSIKDYIDSNYETLQTKRVMDAVQEIKNEFNLADNDTKAYRYYHLKDKQTERRLKALNIETDEN